MTKRCWQETGVAGTATCERLPEVVHCRNCGEYARAGRELFDREISAELLGEWTEAFAAPKAETSRTAVALVIFRLRGEWFGLRAGLFQEVAEQHTVHTVPYRTGGAFLGLVNINGELLLGVSLAALLALEETEAAAAPERPRMCVITRERERFAFPVDEVLGVRRLDTAALAEVPSTVARTPAALTSALIEYHGHSVAVLDEEKLFASLNRSLAW